MSLPDLIINDIVIPRLAGLSIAQDYTPIESAARHRMGDGTLLKQIHWRKLATSIQGSGGWIPPGLESIDWDSSVTIACIAPRAVQSITNVITIPTARRTDHAPWGYAVVNGRPVETDLAIVGNVATLTAVTGATAYRVNYYPLLTVDASLSQESLDAATAEYGWTIEAEEI